MRTVAIVGSGALGLYYGARMARAGREVGFLARGDLPVLRERGVCISYPNDHYTLHPARVFAAPEEMGPADLVVIGLKATANGELARLLPPLIGPDTAVVNLQNGLGVDEAVAAVAGVERTLGALCFVCVNRIAPGVAECTLPGYISLGEFGGGPTARTEAVAEVFRAAGVKTQVAASLLAARWHKLVWNVPFNGLAVAEGGLTTDRILADPMLEARVWGLMREVQAIARAEGVEIAEDFVRDQVEKTRPMGPYRPSTLIDWQAGKPLELGPIWGEPLRRSRIHGVDTPILDGLFASLRACAR
jgi:2-dehydropantoate 2-reductase